MKAGASPSAPDLKIEQSTGQGLLFHKDHTMARIVTPKGIRPGPKRSRFDTARTTSKGFKRFERSVEAFDPIGQQGARIIDVNDHAVRVVGLKPPSDDPTGILAAMDEAIMEEIKDIAKARDRGQAKGAITAREVGRTNATALPIALWQIE